MNEALRNKAIDITRRHLIRQGSRRVSMDMIAREMHISKRTLYIMFSDKQNLVGACMDEMRKEYAGRVGAYLANSTGTAWDNFEWLVQEYLLSLYQVDYSFLIDMQHPRGYNEFSEEYQKFWQQTFEECLCECRQKGFITDGFNIPSFAKGLIGATNKSRIEGSSMEDQQGFCGILARGIRQTG